MGSDGASEWINRDLDITHTQTHTHALFEKCSPLTESSVQSVFMSDCEVKAADSTTFLNLHMLRGCTPLSR